MRKRDLHILTSSIFTYTGDARFGVIHPEASDEWNLRVEYVQKRDAGIYECQVNTEPKINMAILLNVEGKDMKHFSKQVHNLARHLYSSVNSVSVISSMILIQWYSSLKGSVEINFWKTYSFLSDSHLWFFFRINYNM